MKLKHKLLSIVLTSVLLLSIISFVLIKQINDNTDTYNTILTESIVPAIGKSYQIQVDFKKQVQEWKNIQLRGQEPKNLEKYTEKFFAKEKAIRDSVVVLKKIVAFEDVNKMLDEFLVEHKLLGKEYRNALDIYTNSNFDYKASDKAVEGKDRKTTDIFDEVVAKLEEYGNKEYKVINQSNSDKILMISIVIVVLVVLLLIFTFIVVNKLSKNIEVVRLAAIDISNGKIDIELKSESKDELGDLLNSMNLMVINLQNVAQETNSMIENIENGNLKYRCNDTEYQGAWKANLTGINSVVDKIVTPLDVTSNYIALMSRGIIPQNINEEYHGDFNLIKENINELISVQSKVTEFANSISQGNLKVELKPRSKEDLLVIAMNSVKSKILSLVENIEIMSNGLSTGSLYTRIDSKSFEGSYKDLSNNINSSLDVLVNFFNLNSNIMIADKNRNITFINNPLLDFMRQNESNFRLSFSSFDVNKLIGTSIDIFHKNNQHTKDLLSNLRNSFNTVISIGQLKFNITINPITDINGNQLAYIVNWMDISDQINFNNGLENLATQLSKGNLKYRLNSNEVKGDYYTLSNSINAMVSNVIDPLLMTSNYLDMISKGNIPNKIDSEYLGDFNIIKNNINSLLSTMTNLIAELNYMSNEHNLGNIDNFANQTIFEGAFKELIESSNNVVKSHLDVNQKAMNVFAEFGNGNFNEDIPKLPGKKIVINNTINKVRENLVNFNQEMAGLVDAAQKGELDFRADTKTFKGDWSFMVQSLNELLDKIVTPINDAGRVLSHLAEGNLTLRIENNYDGEFEKLKNNINHLAESLDQVLTKVTESVQTTATTTHQLSSAAETMAAAAQEQSAQTDDVASAVEEMSRTITENASNATRTAEVAEKNGQIAIKGGKAVEDTVNKMKDIASVVRNTSNSIEKLGASSQAIGEIISVIDDIADQTNLLALNAAIEAARAGEQGRGFAVVADEVRKLAERTSDATKEIAKMIKSIQQETQDAVQVMQTGTKEVENGIKLADEAGNSLKLIVNSSQELINMIIQISASGEEQSATSEEISSNVMSISKVISDSARQIEEIAESSDNLSQQTVLLTDLMQQFKLSNSNSSNRLDGRRNNNYNVKRLN